MKANPDNRLPAASVEPPSPEESAATAEERRAMQEIEYGTYVATAQIAYDGVLAFDVGHPVPVSHVEQWRKDSDDRVTLVKLTKEK